MDAYALYNKIKDAWQRLAIFPNSGSINKTFAEVPVYTRINDALVRVKDITIESDKIIIEIDQK
jgi:hypothetical protein